MSFLLLISCTCLAGTQVSLFMAGYDTITPQFSAAGLAHFVHTLLVELLLPTLALLSAKMLRRGESVGGGRGCGVFVMLVGGGETLEAVEDVERR
jgi:hypothetical protein